MSNEAMNWAWQVDGLQPVERLLLVAIADYADEQWSSFPGQVLLAERACCSERTVRERLKSLEDKGLFSRQRRYSDGLRSSDRFVLNRGYRQKLPVGAYRQNGGTLPADSGDLTGKQLPGNPYNPNNHQNPSIVSPTGSASTDSEDVVGSAFNSFWELYPRKVGKPVARNAFLKAVKRAGSVEEIVSGASRFAADPNLPEKQFVPHPSTWLNRDGWNDEPLPPRGGRDGGAIGVGRAVDELLRSSSSAAGFGNQIVAGAVTPDAIERGAF